MIFASCFSVAVYGIVWVLGTLVKTEVMDLTIVVGMDKQEYAVDSSAEANEVRYAGIETLAARFALNGAANVEVDVIVSTLPRVKFPFSMNT